MVSTRKSAGWPAASIVVDDADRLDGMGGVGRQDLADIGDIDATAPVGFDDPDLQPMAARHRGPLVREVAGLQDQDRVAGGQQVGQAGLPGAMAGRVVHEQVLLRPKHTFHPGEGGFVDLHELRVVEIDAGAVHRPQDAVGDVGRAGIGEEVAAARLGHVGVLSVSSGRSYTQRRSRRRPFVLNAVRPGCA